MAKLKILPKMLIVAAVVAGLGFGAYQFMPKKAEVPAERELVVETPESDREATTPPEDRVVATEVPAQEAEEPAPEPEAPKRAEEPNDRGLGNLLSSGNK